MTLNPRQRAKINAALTLIYDNGHDAKAVIQQANDLIKQGQDARSAYEQVLNSFLDSEADLAPVIYKALNLIEASDDRTVDKYDEALSAYVSTRDDSGLTAMLPMIAQDTLALALQNGEITQEEAAGRDLAKALGFEPGPALQEALAEVEQPSLPNQRYPLQAVQAAALKMGDEKPADGFGNTSQVSFGGSPTGMIAPKAAKLWAMEAEARAIVHGEALGAQAV